MGKGDQFQKEKFTVPVALGSLTTVEYEIRVGIRCPYCKEKILKAHKCSVLKQR